MHKHWTGDEAGARKSIRKDLGYMDVYERRNLHDLHDAKEMLTARVKALEGENKKLRSQRNAMKRRAERAEEAEQLAEAENKKP